MPFRTLDFLSATNKHNSTTFLGAACKDLLSAFLAQVQREPPIYSRLRLLCHSHTLINTVRVSQSKEVTTTHLARCRQHRVKASVRANVHSPASAKGTWNQFFFETSTKYNTDSRAMSCPAKLVPSESYTSYS